MDIAPLHTFRMLAPEFKPVGSTVVNQWICLCAPFVSKRKFGDLYNQALALLTAHRMKLAGVGTKLGDDPLADIGKIGVGGLMRVNTFTEGETSVGFNSSAGQFLENDAELALTQYGVQFLNIRRMRIMPITSAGEPIGGA